MPHGIILQSIQEMVIDESWVPYKLQPKQAWISDFLTTQRLGIINLNPLVFGERLRLDIIHRVIHWERAKLRSGSANTKTRAEVRGGGRKPQKQKGSGRARVGSTRAPNRVGGGISHGPKPRSYFYPLPNKIKVLGLRAALSVKYAQGDLHVVDALNFNSTSPEEISSILYKHGWDSVLLVDGGAIDPNLHEAMASLEWCDAIPSDQCDVYNMMLRSSLVLSLGAVRMIEQALAPDNPLSKTVNDTTVQLLRF